MRVLFLQPPGLCSAFTRSGSLYPPLGLLQIASNIRGHCVKVLDADAEGWSIGETSSQIAEFEPEVVGLPATSFTLDIVRYWADVSKSIGATVLVGGPHATISPRSIFELTPSIDLVFRGEAEIFAQSLLDNLSNALSHRFPGVCQRLGGSVIIDDLIHQIADLSELELPRFHGLPIEKYWCPDSLRNPVLTIMTTRGCPHRCGFCSSPTVMGRKIRRVSPERIVQLLREVSEEYGVTQISFVDDVLTAHRKHILELCELMAKLPIKFDFFGNARADQIDQTIAEALKAAGCHQLYLGFESGSQKILDGIQKGATVARLVEGAEILRRAGINRSIGFVFGLPGETMETVRESLALAKHLRPERLQFTRFTPLIGSPLEGFLTTSNGFHDVDAEDQVSKWLRQAYQECGYGTLYEDHHMECVSVP